VLTARFHGVARCSASRTPLEFAKRRGSCFARETEFSAQRLLPSLVAIVTVLIIGGLAVNQEALADGVPQNAAASSRIGRVVQVDSPITDRVEDRVRRVAEQLVSQTKFDANADEWPVLVLEIQPGPSDFGKALDLAEFLSGPQSSGLSIVAYVPQTLEGHAVLVALACDEIAMSPGARFGNAAKHEQSIGPAIRSGYVEIAQRRATVAQDLVLGMLDPELEVLEVETDVSREFVLRSRLDEVREQRAVGDPRVLVPAGEPGLFSASEARDLGLVRYIAEDRLAVADALSLSREALQDDPSADGGWQPIRIDVKGPIRTRLVEQLESTIDRQINQNGANFICVWMDTPGGSPEDSQRLATYLYSLDPSQVRTVAYIEEEARADAALIALACDHIVMAPSAVLGGVGAYQLDDEDVSFFADAAADIARRKMRSPSLATAMIDGDLVVYRCLRRDDGRIDYFTQEALEAREDAENWEREEPITTAGRPLKVDGDRALDLRIAYVTANDFAEFKQHYGLESDPALVKPGWIDYLLDQLRSPLAAGTLLAVGLIGLYLELQSPGLGIGGFISGVSFLLFFWAQYLGGTAGWLEVLFFVAGVTCLLIEIFLVPGVGIFGLGGGALVIASLVLASQTFVLPRNDYQVAQLRDSLLMIVGAGVAFFAAAAVARRVLPTTPLFDQVVLTPPSGEELDRISEREAMIQHNDLLGKRGVAATRLSPAGKVRIGEQLVDVITDGDLIDVGRDVVVIEARGNRVVVTDAGGSEVA